MNIDDVLIAVVVFYSIVTFVRILSSHFLKRKLIKAGHYDKAAILEQNVVAERHELMTPKEVSYDRYPSLKWGLVAFFGGLGFIVLEVLGRSYPEFLTYRSSMPYGIFFVSISLGFLLYYFFMSRKALK
ncbi:MAG: hypothetical protein ACEPOZ_03760 [Marinifilaceae bacterium]